MRPLPLAFLALYACSQPSPRPPEPPPPPPSTPDAPGAACAADAEHCCMTDGRIVKPGGCQPVVREGFEANVERLPDGTCKPIECNLRCLPDTARIATPSGDVPVTRLRAGDLVFTLDAAGHRVAMPIVEIVSHPAPATHTLREVTLADGRVLRLSPGHPILDGSPVATSRSIPYGPDRRTWDLRPAGSSGAYWADGVLLGSTLR